MNRDRINMILEIHQVCTEPLYAVLDGINDEQFNWKPAPESRSINEIICHLVRVDISFLKRLDRKADTEPLQNGTVAQVFIALKHIHAEMRQVVQDCADDSELFTRSTIKEAKETDTINEHILHSCQHNLYHLSQVIYLRRATDRSWTSPLKGWDHATRVIARYLKP